MNAKSAKRNPRQMIDERLEQLEAADAILLEAAQNNEPLTGDELSFLRTLGFDDNLLTAERRRANKVARYMCEAQTETVRQQTMEQIVAARKAKTEQAPALDAKIEELTKQLQEAQAARDELENAINHHVGELARMEEGVKKLRDRQLLPPHIRAKYFDEQPFIREIRSPLLKLESRRRTILARLKLDESGAEWLCRQAGTIPDIKHLEVPLGQKLNCRAWNEYTEELRQELGPLEEEIAAREQDLAAVRKGESTILDHYVR